MLYKLEGIKRVHGTQAVLNIDYLEIGEKKVYTLIGPNGAGKTTLLQILAFLDQPSEGLMEYRGLPVCSGEKQLRELRREVVLVDQYPILFTGPVWKNVEYGLKIRGVSKKIREEKTEEVLDLVGMGKFRDADAHRLSGGETKRVALARALALDPMVLLCDEPTANVDTENQSIILQILEDCNRNKKTSLIFATHYFSQAQRLADHSIVLEQGSLTYKRRENVFKATCVTRQGDQSLWSIAEALTVTVSGIEAEVSKRRSLFIDPSTITLCGEADLKIDGVNRCSGIVKKLKLNKHQIQITVDCGVELDFVLSGECYTANPVKLGERVTLQIETGPSMFF